MTQFARDRPSRSGLLGALHLKLGYFAMTVAGLARPKLSLGVRLVALDSQGRVFLVRHSYVPGLHLPGGAVDAAESCATAAEREAREEGDLRLATPPELFHVYWNAAGGRRDHVVLYVARNVTQAAPKPPSLEILASGFYPPDALPDDVTPATRDRLAEVLDKRPRPDRW